MKRISGQWLLFAAVGAALGVGLTLWFWSKTSQHFLSPYVRVSPDQAFTREDRLSMMEAVYRHMFQAASSSIPTGVTCFLGVANSDDPPPELMERLRNLPRPVEPVSSGLERVAPAAKKTGKLGPSFIVRNAQMVSTNEAQVTALIQQEGQTKKQIFAVRRDNSAWTVTEQPNP